MRIYRPLLAMCAIAGVLRGLLALGYSLAMPERLALANPWGVPYWAPTLVCVALSVAAGLMLARQAVLWQALAALWGAGAWAFSTPVLAGVLPTGPWWALFTIALPLALWPIVAELRIGARRLGMLATVLLGLGALGSLARSPQAVAVAASLVYTASIVGPGWLAWWAYRRST